MGTTGCRSVFADPANSTVFTVANQPNVTLTASNNGGFCANTSYNSNKTVLLTATFSHSAGGPAGFNIGWFKNGVLQGTCTTATSPATHTVSAPVSGDLWTVRVNEGTCTGTCFSACTGCAAFASKTLGDLTPTTSISGCTKLSPDETTTLTASTSASLPSYQWYKNSVLISGATSSILSISTTGTYMCEVASGVSPNCKMQVSHVVSAPSGSFNIQQTVPGGNTLEIFPLSAASDYNLFQWYKDGDIISGATSSSYTATTTGYYQLVAKACGPNGKSYYSGNVIKVNNFCAVP